MNVDWDRDILAAVFASRVSLAKKTEDEAADDARKERRAALKWVSSPATKEGSFLWCCDEFELDPGAVCKAIEEKRK